METQRKISTGRKVVYFSIVLFFFLLIAEGLLSMFYYQKSGPEKLASLEALKTIKKQFIPRTVELNVTNHNLVRPDSSNDVNHKIAEETVFSNKFIHESWVEYRNRDFNGQYMNMDGPVRRSVPAAYHNPSANDTIDVYFFGGSTMFGFNVLDGETIPSRFVELYRKNYPGKSSIRVHNYGNPTYYSYQELMLFSDLIFKGHQPDIVVFLDGLNDFWFATASYYRQSYFSYIFRQVFNRGLRSKGEFHFVDSADAMFKDPKYVPLPQYESQLVQNYFENIENIRTMATMAGARAYFFCQPSPFYNYPNQQKDPMCFKDTNTRFNRIYPVIQRRAHDVPNFTYLGDMLRDETGYPFVDGLHYSPRFIDKITEKIFASVRHEFGQAPQPASSEAVATSRN